MSPFSFHLMFLFPRNKEVGQSHQGWLACLIIEMRKYTIQGNGATVGELAELLQFPGLISQLSIQIMDLKAPEDKDT